MSAHEFAPDRAAVVPPYEDGRATMSAVEALWAGAEMETSVDGSTARLVALAAVIAAGDEPELRAAMQRAASDEVPPAWVEELVLQSYMFSGFPRGLNAAREWRRASGRPAPAADEGADFGNVELWRERGERTCAEVYGRFYERLRYNVRSLHPALEEWMIVEGYGKLLGRPALDLRRRELCIIAVCAVSRQERQLHSHFHGALHVGAAAEEIRAVLRIVEPLLPREATERFGRLLDRVLNE